MDTETRKIPEIVYAPDGTKYYPCLYCCRAFAHKRYATLHMKACVKVYLAQLESNDDEKLKVEPVEVEEPDDVAVVEPMITIAEATKPKPKTRKGKYPDVNNSCKLCDEMFESTEELIMHAKIEHNQRGNRHKRTFPPEELEYFYTVFIKSNKTVCPICDKPIGNKLNWKRHLYTHSSIKKYECKVCKKTFTRSDHCKYHEQRHSLKVQKQYYAQYL